MFLLRCSPGEVSYEHDNCVREILTNSRELLAIDANHAQLVDLFATAQIKETETNDTNLLV